MRADRPYRRQSSKRAPEVPGLSRSTQAAVERLEQFRFWPGMVADSVARWAALAYGPAGCLNPRNTFARCGIAECGCDPGHYRDRLEEALHVLPRNAARELRAMVRRLDEQILSRAKTVPAASMDLPWWRGHF